MTLTDKACEIAHAFGVQTRSFPPSAMPLGFELVGFATGEAYLCVQEDTGASVILFEEGDPYDLPGYLLHELAHALAPGSTEDDEMRALVAQYLIVTALPEGPVKEYFLRDFLGYGFLWEAEGSDDFELVSSGTIKDLDAFRATCAFATAYAELEAAGDLARMKAGLEVVRNLT